MNDKLDRQLCISLLIDKKKALECEGNDRYPRRSDFTSEQAIAIKAFLGPWPRALEQAGLKPKDPEREQARLNKRIELKRKKTSAKKARKTSKTIKTEDQK